MLFSYIHPACGLLLYYIILYYKEYREKRTKRESLAAHAPPPPPEAVGTILCCTALYCTLLFSNVLYSTVLYSTVRRKNKLKRKHKARTRTKRDHQKIWSGGHHHVHQCIQKYAEVRRCYAGGLGPSRARTGPLRLVNSAKGCRFAGYASVYGNTFPRLVSLPDPQSYLLIILIPPR